MRIIELDQTKALASTADGKDTYAMPDDFWGLIAVRCRGMELLRVEKPQSDDGTEGAPIHYWPNDPGNVPAITLWPTPLGNGVNDLEITYERKPPVVREA